MRIPYVAGRDQASGLIGSHNRRKSRKNPLKKMLVNSKSIEYCTAWISVSEIIDIRKPAPREVNSKIKMASI
jgi:hypothetical protein